MVQELLQKSLAGRHSPLFVATMQRGGTCAAHGIDAKNVLFFNIDFFGFGPRFRRVLGLQDGAKSAALLAAPGVLKPTEFYACINILLFLTRGGHRDPAWRSKLRMLGPCWHIFRSGASFFRSWLVLERFLYFFGSCWSFFSNFGPPRPRFWIVRARFQSLQNHI